jgi:hypothetical protein
MRQFDKARKELNTKDADKRRSEQTKARYLLLIGFIGVDRG